MHFVYDTFIIPLTIGRWLESLRFTTQCAIQQTVVDYTRSDGLVEIGSIL